MPLRSGRRLDEELHLHLLELAGAEDEIARRDLVAERLADLADAERDLLARGLQHVAVVDEDALCGLRPEVGQARFVLGRTKVRPEQPVEHARLGEGALGAAVRAGDVGEAFLRRVAVLLLVRLDQMVGAEPVVAGQALGQRVDELGDVPAGLPHLGCEDHRGVDPDDVVALLHHRTPPLALDVVLHLHAERAVVPGRPEPSVDLAGGVDDPAPLAKADDLVQAITASCHQVSPSGWRSAACGSRPAAGQRGAHARFPGFPPAGGLPGELCIWVRRGSSLALLRARSIRLSSRVAWDTAPGPSTYLGPESRNRQQRSHRPEGTTAP